MDIENSIIIAYKSCVQALLNYNDILAEEITKRDSIAKDRALLNYNGILAEEITKRDGIAKDRANVHIQETRKMQKDQKAHEFRMCGREETIKTLKRYRTLLDQALQDGNREDCRFYSSKLKDCIMQLPKF